MKVILVASTTFYPCNANGAGYLAHPVSFDADSYVEDADELAEFGGRLCYESWQRPNPKTATNEGYLANILSQGHFSVLEHASASFYIEGVSRSLTHELIRHRHLSYSQVSQRYVNEANREFIIPPELRDDQEVVEELLESHARLVDFYEIIVDRLMTLGRSRKEARSAARCVLPNGQGTAILVTGNMRAWREVIAKRSYVGADKEIQELANLLLAELKELAPNTFQDM